MVEIPLEPPISNSRVAPMPAAGSVRNHAQRVEPLLKAAELHRHEQRLRMGWIWFVGTVVRDGEPERVGRLDLAVRPVCLEDAHPRLAIAAHLAPWSPSMPTITTGVW